jgi:DNA-binding MarR family transcriptional regulator
MPDRRYTFHLMTTKSAAAISTPAVGEALRAYVDVLALADCFLSELWQSAGLTITQLAILRQLRDGPQPAGRLAASVGLSPASATRVLDRLEERHLLTRRRQSTDRRCVDIELQPKGEAILGGLRGLVGSPVHRAIEGMTAEQRNALIAALGQLRDSARELQLSEASPC